MKNFVQPGKSMTVVAGGDIVSGLPYKVGNLIGIAAGKAATGEEYELCLEEGVFELPKASGTTAAQGAKVGWDATNKLVVAAGAGDFDIGHAHVALANGALVAYVKLANKVDVDT